MFADQMTALLPVLRRYTRGLTGSQAAGDAIAIAIFESVLTDRTTVVTASRLEIGLFRVCHRVWVSSASQEQLSDDPIFRKAQEHLSRLTKLNREALLLHTVEDFSGANIAEILDLES